MVFVLDQDKKPLAPCSHRRACEPCNQKKGAQPIEQFLAKKPEGYSHRPPCHSLSSELQAQRLRRASQISEDASAGGRVFLCSMKYTDALPLLPSPIRHGMGLWQEHPRYRMVEAAS
jgi:hypothetical protein